MPFTDKFAPYCFPTLGYIRIPKLEIPEDDRGRLSLPKTATSENYLSELIREGLAAKIKAGIIKESDSPKYKERANMEFLEIKRLLFTDYILLVYRVIKFCKDNGILNGPGRGSGVSSMLLYLLGVTKVDPIKYELLFERFISAARSETKEIDGKIYIKSSALPDVDIDSEGAKKHLVNKFLQDVFPNRTAAILNLSTYQSKIAIKDCLKTMLGFSEDDAKRVSAIIESKFGKVEYISDALQSNEEFKTWLAESPKHIKAVETACIINCLVRSMSVHASGIIICEEELENTLPCQLTSDKKLVASYDMNYCNLLGIKIDNLGLKNLNAIKEAFNATGLNFDNIDLNDPCIYEFLEKSNDFYGIFQAEEGLGKNTIKKIKPRCLEDITLSISLGRPGAMRYIQDYVDFKEGKKTPGDDYPDNIKSILGKTGYIVAYQEICMKLAKVMAGFSPQETDDLRRGIGKKLKEKVLKLKPKFIEGSIKNGYTKEFAEKIFQSFEDSGDYQFNMCLIGETIVETPNGPIPMCEMEIGDSILAYNPKKQKNEYVQIINKFESQTEVYEITLEDGRKIQSSLNHKFMIEGGRMVALSEILQKKLKIMTD